MLMQEDCVAQQHHKTGRRSAHSDAPVAYS